MACESPGYYGKRQCICDGKAEQWLQLQSTGQLANRADQTYSANHTTVLFQRLFGNQVLATTATPNKPGPPATNITEGGDRARAFAFCSSDMVAGESWARPGAGARFANFDPDETATFVFDQKLGKRHDYVLSPRPNPVVMGAPWSSRNMMLNGNLLEMQDRNLPTQSLGRKTKCQRACHAAFARWIRWSFLLLMRQTAKDRVVSARIYASTSRPSLPVAESLL